MLVWLVNITVGLGGGILCLYGLFSWIRLATFHLVGCETRQVLLDLSLAVAPMLKTYNKSYNDKQYDKLIICFAIRITTDTLHSVPIRLQFRFTGGGFVLN